VNIILLRLTGDEFNMTVLSFRCHFGNFAVNFVVKLPPGETQNSAVDAVNFFDSARRSRRCTARSRRIQAWKYHSNCLSKLSPCFANFSTISNASTHFQERPGNEEVPVTRHCSCVLFTGGASKRWPNVDLIRNPVNSGLWTRATFAHKTFRWPAPVFRDKIPRALFAPRLCPKIAAKFHRWRAAPCNRPDRPRCR